MDTFGTLKPAGEGFSFGEKIQISVLETGEIRKICSDGLLLNGFVRGNLCDPLSSVYLREYRDGKITKVTRLNGKSALLYGVSKQGAVYTGTAGKAEYTLTLQSSGRFWFYRLSLKGKGTYDALYTQDIGVGDEGFIESNELYAAQYLGHTVKEGPYGYMVSSRRNSGDKHPVLNIGATDIKVTGYSTDGLQFFGSGYRVTGVPKLLYSDLPCVNHQYEMPFIALSTEKFVLTKDRVFAFYGELLNGNEPPEKDIEKCFSNLPEIHCGLSSPDILSENIRGTSESHDFESGEIKKLYKNRTAEEFSDPEKDGELEGGTLLSFFTDNGAYVATKAKEKMVERPHGNISVSGFDIDKIPSGVMTNTSYMYGMFCSQTLTGNTSFNKLFPVSRGFLDFNYTDGLRIYIKTDGKYKRLKVPGLFETGLNYCSYIYKLKDDVIRADVYTSFEKAQVNLDFRSEKGISYDCLITMKLTAGERDGLPVRLSKDGNTLRIRPAEGPAMSYCRDLNYAVKFGCNVSFSDDRLFYKDGIPRDETLLTAVLHEKSFKISVAGEEKKEACCHFAVFSEEKEKFTGFYDKLLRSFSLKGEDRRIEKFNLITRRFAHDCLIHYASPHGLEQTGGAAWGTRDVCQGPFEFFMTFSHYAAARNIILKVFSFQKASGDWPQWFMFDGYPFAAGDCHGDIVFWPLKNLETYLEATGDFKILDEVLPHLQSEEKTTVFSHLEKALSVIESRFIQGTALITYDGGDWNDSLQPVHTKLKDRLVSSWTMALAYETLSGLENVLNLTEHKKTAARCGKDADRIKKAFFKYLVKDGVTAGFGYLDDGKVKLMLHPSDKTTGIHLRLLPLTRTIISHMAPPCQAEKNAELIEKYLRCPDGVRLMDNPPPYNGGTSRIFLRAEQAANVGREIGLQYVHAHIRYIEAMTVLGHAKEALWGLFAVNPVNIRDTVPSAMPRQSDCYFSSSEGCFNDRYEFRENFNKLLSGDIPVRSGWRVYSSGGGIYLARLVSDFMGLRVKKDNLILDPVLPLDMLGKTAAKFDVFDKTVTVCYVKGRKRRAVINKKTYHPTEENPYREGGVKIPLKDIPKDCTITFYLK